MKLNKLQTNDDLQIAELQDTVEVKLPENFESMDFADRMEYYWNLSED